MNTAKKYIPQNHLEIVQPVAPFDIIDFEVDYFEELILVQGYEKTLNIPFAKYKTFALKEEWAGDFFCDIRQGSEYGQEEWSVSFDEYLEEHIELDHIKKYISDNKMR